MYSNDAFIRPRYEETDQMGVVYHGNYLTYFEVGRSEFFRKLGYPYKELEKEGVILPVIHASCEYILPAKYDDELFIRTYITELKGARLELQYKVIRIDEGEEKILANGITKHAFVNSELKPIRMKRENPRMWKLIEGCLEGDVKND